MSFANRSPFALLTLAASFAFLTAACGGDGPSAPVIERGPVILLGDGQTEDSIALILTEAGIPFEMAGPYWEYDGGGLDTASAAILLTGYDYLEEMPEAAQHAVVAFVEAGGGLMTTEWMLYNLYYEFDAQSIVAAIAPAVYLDDYDYEGEEYKRLMPGHPVAQGLPATFSTSGDWTWILTAPDPAPAKQAQVVFGGESSGAAVIAGVHGQGRTVHWAMAGEYNGSDIWSMDVRKLLVNIVSYISKRT